MEPETILAKLDCGDYGEEEFIATTAGPGVVELHVSGASGRRTTRVQGADRLLVRSELWGAANCIGLETDLLLDTGGGLQRVIHFELNSQWGGVHDDAVFAAAEAVGRHTGCRVERERLRKDAR